MGYASVEQGDWLTGKTLLNEARVFMVDLPCSVGTVMCTYREASLRWVKVKL